MRNLSQQSDLFLSLSIVLSIFQGYTIFRE